MFVAWALQQLLALSPLTWTIPPSVPPPPSNTPLRMRLLHLHGVTSASRTVFHDIAPSTSLAADTFTLSTVAVRVHRPSSYSAFSRARWKDDGEAGYDALQWDPEDVPGPNVSSRATLRALAQMTNNAYTEPGKQDWYDLGSDWASEYPFGWEPDADGFRGHVFVSEDNSTVVVSIKGTSAGWLVGGGGHTIKKDRLNDNLLSSCCCARVGPTWSTVCGCYAGSHKCDQGCIEKALVEDSLFYPIGVNLYNNITYMYPDANIWLTGHSLGGMLASLIGATFGAPVVAFEAIPERLAARRLHLPSPPSTQHITHVLHTADPIAQGTCTGITSTCALGGYALESRCHLGRVIRYDTVARRGWAVDVRTHGIVHVIERLLDADWEPPLAGGMPGREVPAPEVEEDCVDCYQWDYGNYGKTDVLTGAETCG